MENPAVELLLIEDRSTKLEKSFMLLSYLNTFADLHAPKILMILITSFVSRCHPLSLLVLSRMYVFAARPLAKPEVP